MAQMTRGADVLNNLLEKQYDKFRDMVNYGFEFLEGVERQAASTTLNGEKFTIPYVAKRFGTGEYITAEGGALAPIRKIDGETVEFDVVEYNDRLGVSWKSLSMDKGNKSLKLSIARRLKIALDENREKLDKDSIFGNKVRGFINERVDTTTWVNFAGGGAPAVTAAGGGGANGIFNTLEYDGDFTPFLNCVHADVSTYVPINLVCLDDYAYIADGHGITIGGAGLVALYVSAIDIANGTLELALVDNLAGGGSTADWLTAGVIAPGFALAVELAPSVPIAGTGTVAFWTGTAVKEMTGAFTQLFAQDWGGKDRSSADRPFTRAIGVTMANSGAHARTGFSPSRVAKFLAQVQVQGGELPTSVWCNPFVRAAYVDGVTSISSTVTARRDLQSKSTVDMVPNSLEIAGEMFRTCKNMPDGLLLWTRLEDWTILVPMDSGGVMIDWRRYDGQPDGPFWRDDPAGTASAIATLYGIFQLVAQAPNCGNGLICGISRV
jgi:hypothetical protein